MRGSPPVLTPVTQNPIRPIIPALLTTILAFIVYSLTVAPDLTWAYYGTDGGELITAAVTLGVPHPPGYPLYVILGKLVSVFPAGTVAFRFNLFSALCMATAAGVIAGLVAALLSSTPASLDSSQNDEEQRCRLTKTSVALAAGLTFAFLPLVWQQAIIAEVYALNMLVVSVLLWSILQPSRSRSGWLPGLFLGLAVTTHLTSLLLAPLVLFRVGSSYRKYFVPATLTGLTPFLLLPLFASTGSPVVWGSPHTFRGWWWLVTATIYRPNVFSLPADAWTARLSAWAQHPTLWIAVALLALILYHRQLLQRRLGLMNLLALATVGLYLLYSFTYNAPDALVFTLPALALLCILAGLTLQQVGPLLLFLPLALLVLNFQYIDLSERTSGLALVEPALRVAPPNAIILTSGDRTTFTFWYLRHVKKQRQDVTVVDDNLLAFDWYRERLAAVDPSLKGLQSDDLWRFRKLNEQERPWCEIKLDSDDDVNVSCTEAQQ